MDTTVLQSVDRTFVLWKGEKFLFFGGYDYHRHSSHPKVISAFQRAAKEYGINSGGSLWTTGTHPFHKKLEKEICEFLDCEGVALFPSCYLANQALTHYFIGINYNIFYPENSHPSLTPIINAQPYSELDELKSALNNSENSLILVESIIDNGNEIAPLDQIIECVPGTQIFIDDAHGISVVGRMGRGIFEYFKLEKTNIIRSGSLSKGIGVYGGFITGSKQFIETLKNTSPIYQGSSSLPIPVCAAAIESIKMLKYEQEKISKLQNTAISFKDSLISKGVRIPLSETPVCALNITESCHIKEIKENLIKNRIFPSLIHYPGSPPEGIFRFAISSVHSKDQTDNLLSVLRSIL